MANIRKSLIAAAVALGLGAASVAVYAGPGGCGPMVGGMGPAGYGGKHRSPEDMKAYFEKRKSELHDKLKLNANQETAWQTYISKVTPTMSSDRPDSAEMQKLPAPERMEKMLGFMKEGENRLATATAATKEFYAVLTPEQQKIFNEEFPARGHGRHRRGPG